jgi:hypothetical protein
MKINKNLVNYKQCFKIRNLTTNKDLVLPSNDEVPNVSFSNVVVFKEKDLIQIKFTFNKNKKPIKKDEFFNFVSLEASRYLTFNSINGFFKHMHKHRAGLNLKDQFFYLELGIIIDWPEALSWYLSPIDSPKFSINRIGLWDFHTSKSIDIFRSNLLNSLENDLFERNLSFNSMEFEIVVALSS